MSRLHNILNTITTKLLPTESRSLAITRFEEPTQTTKWFAKPVGVETYGAFLIIGTFAGVGGMILNGSINGSALGQICNRDGTVYTSTAIQFSYKVENNIGYLGVKTTGSGTTRATIIWG